MFVGLFNTTVCPSVFTPIGAARWPNHHRESCSGINVSQFLGTG